MRNLALLSLVTSVPLVLGACTTLPDQRPGATPVTAAESGSCLRETGSRIRPAAGECLPFPGRVVYQDDLQRSGAINVRDALNRLGVI